MNLIGVKQYTMIFILVSNSKQEEEQLIGIFLNSLAPLVNQKEPDSHEMTS